MTRLKMIDLAEQLLKQAEAKKIAWAKAIGRDVYLLRLPDMSLTITRVSLLPGPPPPLPGLPALPDLRGIATLGYKLELFEGNPLSE